MIDEKERVLTRDELRDVDITPELAAQVLEQSQERARYMLELRHKIETRAATLLRTFLSLALAIVGYGFAIERLAHHGDLSMLHYVMGAAPLFIACGCMIGAIWDRSYLTLGGPAKWWLNEEAISGDARWAAYFNACLASDYDRGIGESYRANHIGVLFIRWGLGIALLTPLSLLVAF